MLSEQVRKSVSVASHRGKSIVQKLSASCCILTKHSQSYCYCVNQETEMKNKDSREKLTKAQMYCYRREQSIQLHLQENRHVYIGKPEKEEERSPTESIATVF